MSKHIHAQFKPNIIIIYKIKYFRIWSETIFYTILFRCLLLFALCIQLLVASREYKMNLLVFKLRIEKTISTILINSFPCYLHHQAV